MAFKDSLRSLRKQAGLTQEELVKGIYNRCGIQMSKSAISMYECGRREPELEVLEAFADYFNVDLNQLAGHAGVVPLVNEDPELTEYLQMLATRDECRMLFSLAKDATKEDVMRAVKIIEALREE